jgi:hypothetical protein
MKRIVTILLALALAVTGASADQWRDIDIDEIIKSLPGAEEYADADAVFAAVQELIEIGDDGSQDAYRNLLVKVLTLSGREKYSNQTFTYDSDMSEIFLEKGQTIRKTGRVVDVEEDAVNDVTPAFLDDASIYANVLQKVISFPVVGAGSTMELQLHEKTTPAKDGSFSGIEYFGGEDPFLHHEFTVRFPKDVTVATSATNGGLELAKLKEDAGRGEITWTAKNIRPLVPEDNMPPRSELMPRVLYSSYASWDEAAAFFAGEFFPHVQADGAVAEWATELTAGISTDSEKLWKVLTEVTTEIRNIHLSLGLGGYEPNDAGKVLENRYADTRDKAVLLVSALKAVGMEVYPALVMGQRGAFVEAVPTLKQFDRLLVAVPTEEGYRFVDPFLDDVELGYLRWGRGNTALVVKGDGSGELVEIPEFSPDENFVYNTMSIILRDDGSAMISSSVAVKGYFDRKTRRALKDATPSEQRKVFETAANRLSPGSTELNSNISDMKKLNSPARVGQAIEAPDFAVTQGEFVIVRVPPFPFEFATLAAYPSLSERKLPFDLPCEAHTIYDCKFIVPPSLEVARLPTTVVVERPDAEFRLTCNWLPDEGHIFWKREIIFKEKTISLESYEAFKNAYDAATSPKSSLLLLKKSGPSLGRTRN